MSTEPKTITMLLWLALLAAPGFPYRGDQPPAASEDVVFVGAGDIANCDLLTGARATAALLDGIEWTIFTLGDHAYLRGTDTEFRRCYDPTWGRHKARTHPTPGNHDYLTSRGRPYFDYFGAAAGPEERGYYNTLLDLIYARAPNNHITDQLVCSAMHCRPQVWQRIKTSLMAKGKVQEVDGYLTANRVQTTLQTAAKLMSNRSRSHRVSALKRAEIKWLGRDPD
jgi:hypothetical protein